MPKVWITPDRFGDWEMFDNWEDITWTHTDVVAVEMNGSLHRQIRAAEKKYEKFQDILEKFYVEGVVHPKTVRRVK